MNRIQSWMLIACLAGGSMVGSAADPKAPTVKDKKLGTTTKSKEPKTGNSSVPLSELAKMHNLIPNAGLNDPANPLQGWRVEYPGEDFYVGNEKYVRVVASPAPLVGKQTLELSLSGGQAGGQGVKVETPFVKAEPGATYIAAVDCMTWDGDSKLFVEVYITDPSPDVKRNTINAVRAGEGHGPLYKCYRAQFCNPPGGSKQWTTMTREFTLPEKVKALGETLKPEFMTVKAIAIMGSKNYYSNFRLYKVDGDKVQTNASAANLGQH